MNSLFPGFEHRAQPVITHRRFLVRLSHSGGIVLVLIVVSLFIGMLGYRVLEGLSWIDGFLDAAMLLGGMGPVHVPVTYGGKLFAGLYALYCGLVVIFITGMLLAPVAHRVLHRFHMEEEDGKEG
jgi:hypothetical protein